MWSDGSPTPRPAPGRKLRGWMRFAHTGELGGVVGQLLAGRRVRGRGRSSSGPGLARAPPLRSRGAPRADGRLRARRVSDKETRPMHADVLQAINVQINSEFSAWYQYLAMAAFCEREKFTGRARWLKAQSVEEYQHGMKLFDFVLARNGVVELTADQSARPRVRVVRRGVRGGAQAGGAGHRADQRSLRAGVQVARRSPR